MIGIIGAMPEEIQEIKLGICRMRYEPGLGLFFLFETKVSFGW